MLKDVLRALDFDKDTAAHVQFTGGDRFGETVYDASIPIHKAVSDYGDVMLAWEMNDEPIPRDHGVCCVVFVGVLVGFALSNRNDHCVADVSCDASLLGTTSCRCAGPSGM